jgi:threonine aldolase
MFGGSLRQAWPYAAVALHYLDGFAERFGRAVAAADALFDALQGHRCCEIVRSASGTNVARLHFHRGDAATLPERLLARGVSIRPALHSSSDGAEFELYTNETILRRPTAEIIEIFVAALGSG